MCERCHIANGTATKRSAALRRRRRVSDALDARRRPPCGAGCRGPACGPRRSSRTRPPAGLPGCTTHSTTPGSPSASASSAGITGSSSLIRPTSRSGVATPRQRSSRRCRSRDRAHRQPVGDGEVGDDDPEPVARVAVMVTVEVGGRAAEELAEALELSVRCRPRPVPGRRRRHAVGVAGRVEVEMEADLDARSRSAAPARAPALVAKALTESIASPIAASRMPRRRRVVAVVVGRDDQPDRGVHGSRSRRR